MSHIFSRQELYHLLWSTPILQLAERFGISDRGLAKTCKRFHIAVPGRGYWAKIEAGQQSRALGTPSFGRPSVTKYSFAVG